MTRGPRADVFSLGAGTRSQVREIATDYFEGAEFGGSDAVGLRWQSSALLALQEATEACVPFFLFLVPTLLLYKELSPLAMRQT